MKKYKELSPYEAARIDALYRKTDKINSNQFGLWVVTFLIIIFLTCTIIYTRPFYVVKPVCSSYQVEEVAEIQKDCVCYIDEQHTMPFKKMAGFYCDDERLIKSGACWLNSKAVLVNKTTDKCLEYKVVPR